MLKPRKIIEPDGKVWWGVFDTDTMKFDKAFKKYKTRKECKSIIDIWNNSLGIFFKNN